MCLADSDPKVLTTEMPIVWLIPMEKAEIEPKHTYSCPVYITS